jgi:hypothetical protein
MKRREFITLLGGAPQAVARPLISVYDRNQTTRCSQG